MKTLPWHSKAVLALTAFLPVFLMISALGTKFGLWSWKIGLLALTMGAGVLLVVALALVAAISLVLVLLKKPRDNMRAGIALVGLVLAGGIGAVFGSMVGTAADNPIHDVATDTANPPAFSAATMAAREKAGANPLNDYQTPLGDLALFEGVSPALAIRSHAQIITETYPTLRPLPLGQASPQQGVAAVAAAMDELGFKNIRSDAENGIVEGVAETFWFGFKDDVVARITDKQIDFRSVSRVGQSDLGANAKRIAALRAATAAKLGGG
ncbi:MAG: DUF1499 domain-containing protein [Erythrobacter sp.]